MAPSSRASSKLRGLPPTAMMVLQPATAAPMMADMPTAPQPYTATWSSEPTLATLIMAPAPVCTPQPSGATRARSTSSSTLETLAADATE